MKDYRHAQYHHNNQLRPKQNNILFTHNNNTFNSPPKIPITYNQSQHPQLLTNPLLKTPQPAPTLNRTVSLSPPLFNNNMNTLPNYPKQTIQLYEQLKQRQIQYIALIKDLHQQNLRLNGIIKQLMSGHNRNMSDNSLGGQISQQIQKNYNNLINGNKRTPSFNSPTNSRAIDNLVKQKTINNYVNNNQQAHRISFGDLRQNADKYMNNMHTAYNNSQTEVFHVPKRVQNEDNRVQDNKKLLSAIKTTKSINNQMNSILQNQGELNRQQFWKNKTIKSISRQSRGSVQYNVDDDEQDKNYDDHISQYSTVCANNPYVLASNNKLKRLIVTQNSPKLSNSNSGSNILSQQSIVQAKKPQKIEPSKMINHNNKNTQQSSNNKHQQLTSIRSARSTRQSISNKVYL